ncbi:metallophosphoesterase [Pseudomonas syringae pv. actinidiae]|nr:metallophosphoesterase [Pseudomonas syringae pv. actinidiae]
MRLHIISDLHLDYWSMPVPALVEADVCLIAGDLHEGLGGLPFALEIAKTKPVIFVAGNHEFYGSSLKIVREQWREASEQHKNVYFLDNSTIEFDGVRFIGATLWTDFDRGSPLSLMRGSGVTKDFLYIDNDEGDERITAQFLYDEHQRSLAFIRSELEKPYDGKTVILSHHAPSKLSVPEVFKNDTNNFMFCSDLDYLMHYYNVTLYVHGHMHTESDYMIGDTPVIANPRGTSSFPNPNFDPFYVKTI